MNGHQYEHAVAKYLRNHGFSNVVVTRASGDYGADIIATKRGRKYAVQCKYYSNPVGLKSVQEVVASKKHYRCSRGMVVTNSSFTKPAKILAEENNVILLEHVNPKYGESRIHYVPIVLAVIILGVALGIILSKWIFHL